VALCHKLCLCHWAVGGLSFVEFTAFIGFGYAGGRVVGNIPPGYYC
jgi:hypothetical protein